MCQELNRIYPGGLGVLDRFKHVNVNLLEVERHLNIACIYLDLQKYLLLKQNNCLGITLF